MKTIFKISNQEIESTLYGVANSLCNSLDMAMLELNKDMKGRVCEISDGNIYETKHKINEAFKHIVKARELLRTN